MEKANLLMLYHSWPFNAQQNVLIDKKIYDYNETNNYLVMFHGKFNFNDTIKNNIVFDQTIDDKEYLNKIIDLIGINEIPIYHENKEIGDDGGILSGGQKQRLQSQDH